jgi:hypothetical protein
MADAPMVAPTPQTAVPQLAKPLREVAFYVVLALVFTITVGSLSISLWLSLQRTAFIKDGYARLEKLNVRGDAPATQSNTLYADTKAELDQESNKQNDTILILEGVFQAGTGAILGLLTGKATAK